jgi:hypothetical protein
MGSFLDEPWLAACNEALAALPAADADRTLVVTQVVTDAPQGALGVVTLVADRDGVRMERGERPDTAAWLTLSATDAEALHEGTLDPARALTEGRVKVRGDLRQVVEGAAVLAAAHEALRGR